MLLSAHGPQAVIEDSGSTNRPGMRVTLDQQGHASVEPRNAKPQHITLDKSLCDRFLRDLKAAAPVNALPARHCFKSVSFGSRLFVEFEGNRSPDLSCPGQQDPRAEALQKDAQQILQAAQKAAGVTTGRPIG